ncbi:hypothetical protein [Cronobacter malonaticus]|uniref:hypothetical protein n=1 Tax=Cronobacter malonaticus TaxID=413503 RepID=UPI000CFCE23E|nr:hypothetical protein [Cronobacter malonaticus]ELY5855477.1 hypothetical protein [Cronobacter malonaticus]WRU13697.1 hypothetical protein U9L39_15895 [Cronobacter malonaticus]
MTFDTAKLKAVADLLLNATEISNQLRHLADNEIDSDSFAVVTENYNGRDTEFERPITDLAIDAAVLIDELIAALEAAEKRVGEQDEYVAELEERNLEILRQARSFREAHESASEIIRTLERKKPTVTLPATRLWAGKVACFEESEIISLLVSAGINFETGGEA